MALCSAQEWEKPGCSASEWDGLPPWLRVIQVTPLNWSVSLGYEVWMLRYQGAQWDTPHWVPAHSKRVQHTCVSPASCFLRVHTHKHWHTQKKLLYSWLYGISWSSLNTHLHTHISLQKCGRLRCLITIGALITSVYFYRFYSNTKHVGITEKKSKRKDGSTFKFSFRNAMYFRRFHFENQVVQKWFCSISHGGYPILESKYSHVHVGISLTICRIREDVTATICRPLLWFCSYLGMHHCDLCHE